MTTRRPLRVLFLCTRNAARSQIAEAILTSKGGRFEAGSAGLAPVAEIDPLALAVLADRGIDWRGHRPKGFDAVREDKPWDFVITVCARAQAHCPLHFPGHPIFAHWETEDPSEVFGDDARRYRAYRDALTELNRRIELFLAVPMDRLEREALERRVQGIGAEGASHAKRRSE